MSFNTSISGLNAAQKDLNVTSNNIANAKSTGFKKSRAEFGDIYAVSAFGNSKTSVGQGVINQAVTQQFTQGNLDFTDRSLDLAISGEGFFAFQPSLDSAESVFSRAGALGVNKDGYLVNQAGEFLKGLPTDAEGNSVSTSLATADPVRLPAEAGEPRATTTATQLFNLPSEAEGLPVSAFNWNDPETYTQANSQRVFDSLGNPHTLTSYFVKDAGQDNTWRVYYQFDNEDPVNFGSNTHGIDTDGDSTADVTVGYQMLRFDGNGSLTDADGNLLSYGSGVPGTSMDPENPTLTLASPGTGAEDLSVQMRISRNSTQYAAGFNIGDQGQDGYTTGQLTGVSVGSDGLIRASYSNGQNQALGKVALVDFRNPQALKQVGNNQWIETVDSGEPLAGEAGTGTFGAIQGGALETSNVDLTAELVNLITAQRNFQANSRAIEANKALSDTIIGIR
ncbi:flagellar hook protein FlgE [Guyparkeria hydrothermalis]|uniref:flagellar hook protein FlgE n=1 Tax=Guyparkeria hydrothermalis TaxID=923 RepID=UPI00202047A0|nr:flagellar hook protein FlgE [Guyparkeria hydrothermalis]MCL7743438.1 flagellar hook protein FlgE [Guyparkeria hydrothermalis]